MRESSPVPVWSPVTKTGATTDGDSSTVTKNNLLLAIALAIGTVAWQHVAIFGAQGSLWAHAPYLLVDVLLALPVAALAVGAVSAFGLRVKFRRGSGQALKTRTIWESAGTWEPVARAAAITVVLTVLYIPLAIAQAVAHSAIAPPTGHHHGATGLPATDFSGLFGYGLTQALQIETAILVLALAGVTVFASSPRGMWRSWLLPKVKPASRIGWALTLVVGALAGTLSSATAQSAPVTQEAGTLGGSGGCQSAPQRVFNISAIDVDIVVNRTGDHDPYGYMFVLNANEAAVRAQEAALKAASSLPVDDPTAAKVSNGLGQDAIQPLVLRARLGECVVINLTNKIVNAPRGGPNGNPVVTQPGGVPPVSIDMAGVSYDAAAGQGGQAVGANPVNMATSGGAAKQYRYFLDPLMGEGAKVFRSGGDSVQLTAHGLFGTLIAEDSGARWYDPVSGLEKTSDNNWSNWEAMVDPAVGPTFREATIIYHEIGDENFNLRRPLRENADAAPVGDQVQNGRPLPMIDTGAPNPANPRAGGGGTNAYRPGSRALNYRSEPFFRRLQNEAPRGLAAQQNNESIAYSSYPYGDPATPIVKSYLGEPTKTRLVHAGFEQLHVHHLHGGATRWRQNPGADNTAMDTGLTKVPIQNAKSIRLDSQTISPMEAMNLEHECGAGGCQQAAGDFLFHCHIAHHYIAGMWGMWRVFDTAQSGLARLPGRAAAPTAVNSAGLLGRVIEGKTVVLQANLTSPSTQVALEALVEGQLPPQGVRFALPTGPDPDDATVWDWQKGGTATAPVYLGEPETASVWDNYRSPTPGVRPEILFNPVNGRPAYPMLKPHLGMRPPFSPNGHSGAPYLGNTASTARPDGLCPSTAPNRGYDITAISVGVQNTHRETDANGEIFVLNEDKSAVLGGTKPVEPLTIRSNVGDCVSITFGQQLDPAIQGKTNMHTHFVQFDPRASDGVITGFAYEQSVFSMNKEARTLSSVNTPSTITVSGIGQLRVGVSVGIGVGTANIEIRTITAITGNVLTLDTALAKAHAAGEPVTVEFVQYRWYSDVDSGTVFWHDHVDGIESWAHGLFGAHIIEPAGSTYRDPVTGAAIKSGTQADIYTSGSVGVGQSGNFREFMIFLHNGRRGRNELTAASGGGLTPFNAGQECEEGSINLKAEPVGERTPPGATPADPATTMQRQEYSGQRCRNAFTRGPDDPANANATTTRATVSTVDPYVFSSVKYGDPMTPLLRAYAGDPVVIRTIGLNERAEALRIQGHRFRMERFNADGQLMDSATTGISERFDYVLDGGAGGTARSPGDYLYYSTRTFALESGAWGIFRVYDKLQGNLKPLPNKTPPTGSGFPKQTAATGNTQAAPGPNPAPGWNANGSPNTAVVSSLASPCPGGVPFRTYDVSVFNKALPTAPFSDTSGVIYSLTADMAGIVAGTKPIEPLVIRANKGDCVDITFRNQLTPGSLYGGTRAGMDLAKLSKNQELASGAAVGLNPDTTVAIGGSIVYRYYADQELGTNIFQNLGSVGSLRHGAYGMLIVEPQGSIYQDSFDGSSLNSTNTATQAVIRPPGSGNDFREFALQVQTTDQQYSRSIIPYIDQVAGIGINSVTAANIPVPPVEGAPPGTAGNAGSLDKAYSSVNYRSEPLTVRLGLTANPANYTAVTVNGNYGIGFCSTPYGDPDTPVLLTYGRDPVVWRVAVGASDQLHSFTLGGHTFPLEPKMWNGTTDKRSQLLTARTIAAGETIDVELTSAGGSGGFTGDYLYQDARSPFAEAGIWGIFRVLPLPFAAAAVTAVPIEIAEQ